MADTSPHPKTSQVANAIEVALGMVKPDDTPEDKARDDELVEEVVEDTRKYGPRILTALRKLKKCFACAS